MSRAGYLEAQRWIAFYRQGLVSAARELDAGRLGLVLEALEAQCRRARHELPHRKACDVQAWKERIEP